MIWTDGLHQLLSDWQPDDLVWDVQRSLGDANETSSDRPVPRASDGSMGLTQVEAEAARVIVDHMSRALDQLGVDVSSTPVWSQHEMVVSVGIQGRIFDVKPGWLGDLARSTDTKSTAQATLD
jgi:hypothetical protein